VWSHTSTSILNPYFVTGILPSVSPKKPTANVSRLLTHGGFYAVRLWESRVKIRRRGGFEFIEDHNINFHKIDREMGSFLWHIQFD